MSLKFWYVELRKWNRYIPFRQFHIGFWDVRLNPLRVSAYLPPQRSAVFGDPALAAVIASPARDRHPGTRALR